MKNRARAAELVAAASLMLEFAAEQLQPARPCLGQCDEGHTYGVGCELAGTFDAAELAPAEPVATQPEPPAPVVYQLPGPPPIETQLRDAAGTVWRIDRDSREQPYGVLVAVGPEADPFATVGEQRYWHELLGVYGPLHLVEQDAEDKRLYGPWGGRWAMMGTQCPVLACVYWHGHADGHRDRFGVDPTNPADQLGPVSVTPAQAAETVCSCGRPAAHKPGCPRYGRTAGYEGGSIVDGYIPPAF